LRNATNELNLTWVNDATWSKNIFITMAGKNLKPRNIVSFSTKKGARFRMEGFISILLILFCCEDEQLLVVKCNFSATSLDWSNCDLEQKTLREWNSAPKMH